MDPVDLERLVATAIERLPAPTAPPTLRPRVLDAIGMYARRPWYRREWLAWPVAWQVVSLAALAGLAVSAAIWLPAARTAVEQTLSVHAVGPIGDLATAIEPLAAAAQSAESTTSAVRVIWRVVFAPVVLYASGLVVLMCFACMAFMTALTHLTFGKALPR